MTTSTAYCESVPASVLHAEISKLGVEHLLIVPDTHQKTLLRSLNADPAFKMHTSLRKTRRYASTPACGWAGLRRLS